MEFFVHDNKKWMCIETYKLENGKWYKLGGWSDGSMWFSPCEKPTVELTKIQDVKNGDPNEQNNPNT